MASNNKFNDYSLVIHNSEAAAQSMLAAMVSTGAQYSAMRVVEATLLAVAQTVNQPECKGFHDELIRIVKEINSIKAGF